MDSREYGLGGPRILPTCCGEVLGKQMVVSLGHNPRVLGARAEQLIHGSDTGMTSRAGAGTWCHDFHPRERAVIFFCRAMGLAGSGLVHVVARANHGRVRQRRGHTKSPAFPPRRAGHAPDLQGCSGKLHPSLNVGEQLTVGPGTRHAAPPEQLLPVRREHEAFVQPGLRGLVEDADQTPGAPRRWPANASPEAAQPVGHRQVSLVLHVEAPGKTQGTHPPGRGRGGNTSPCDPQGATNHSGLSRKHRPLAKWPKMRRITGGRTRAVDGYPDACPRARPESPGRARRAGNASGKTPGNSGSRALTRRRKRRPAGRAPCLAGTNFCVEGIQMPLPRPSSSIRGPQPRAPMSSPPLQRTFQPGPQIRSTCVSQGRSDSRGLGRLETEQPAPMTADHASPTGGGHGSPPVVDRPITTKAHRMVLAVLDSAARNGIRARSQATRARRKAARGPEGQGTETAPRESKAPVQPASPRARLSTPKPLVWPFETGR